MPGTTRDLVREQLDIDGLPVHIVDTAGLRETSDVVEREGVQRTRGQLAVADLTLLVVDATDPAPLDELLAEVPAGVPVILVRNKIDLTGEAPGVDAAAEPAVVRLSARTGAGPGRPAPADQVTGGLRRSGRGHDDRPPAASRQHPPGPGCTSTPGCEQLELNRAGELLAEELRGAQLALAEITGEFTSDDLLGEIFGRFCIGK